MADSQAATDGRSPLGHRWDLRPFGAVGLAAAVLFASTGLGGGVASADPGPRVSVIVREAAGSGGGPEQAVARLGGTVGEQMPALDSFAAELPAGSLDALRAVPGVHTVTPDASVRLMGGGGKRWDGWTGEGDSPAASLPFVADAVNAKDLWGKEADGGTGIGVALIDSGVVPVPGLDAPGKIVDGPDLSFESMIDDAAHLDTYGHGTHMASIIAGRDGKGDAWKGIAPGAHVVSLKVASFDGATDVSQILAAINWVVEHKDDPGVNIRVLNLSFGTDSTQSYVFDPLTYAVEVAWRKGIVVVVAGGNDGPTAASLTNPAYDPFVISVGAADLRGTTSTNDDLVANFSSWGNDSRRVDLVAPGVSILGLRNPGSLADVENPEALVAERFFRGSGSSQAAAVTSGAVALLLGKRPTLTPDQVKYLLKATASAMPVAQPLGRGAGLVNAKRASDMKLPTLGLGTSQLWLPATGLGSLEATRGTSHLTDIETGIDLVGEIDIMGQPFDSAVWSVNSALGTTWDGGLWNGSRWTGDGWTGGYWAGDVWTGSRWTGSRWTGENWAGSRWTGSRWTGSRWTGSRWTGDAWTGSRWTGSRWTGSVWTGYRWRMAR